MFYKIVKPTGFVVSKTETDKKGGVFFSVKTAKNSIPIYFVTKGEKIDDICFFDEKFIDDVNSELGDDEQIDKKDARKANTAFKIDFAEMQKKYKNWFDEKYDEIVRESMVELFGDDTPLNNKTIKDLKLHIYENGWQNELKKEELNIRSEILGLLYHKLEEKVSEKLSIDANKLWNEVCDCGCRKNRSHKCNDDTCCFDKWPDDDFLSDFAKKIKAIDKINRIFF